MKPLRLLATMVATYLHNETEPATVGASAEAVECPQCTAVAAHPYGSEPCEDDAARRHISLRCRACGYLWFMQC